MKITQIRNATLIVEYAEKKFLIDPFLAEKDTYPAFPYTELHYQTTPCVGLPISIDEIVKVDAVIVTHLHLDHFDDAAKEALPKDIKIFAQSEEEAEEIRKAGFKDVAVLQEDGAFFENIKLTKTKGMHGIGEAVFEIWEEFRQQNISPEVCGVVFNHPNEKTLYIAGDTVWYDDVQEAIETHAPDIIVLNAGDAKFEGGHSIIMGKKDVYEVYKAAPHAKIIASHMESVNHASLSRKELKSFLSEKEISSSVLVPDDGETYTF